jgi:hypothetical protein
VSLEIRKKSAGFGYQRQTWPRAVHHIVRVGRTETRLIVETGEMISPLAIVSLLIGGLFS